MYVYLDCTSRVLELYWQDQDACLPPFPGQSLRCVDLELQELINRIDLVALCARATSLREGISCTAPELTSKTFAVSGNNLLIPLTFEDGVQWEARIRLPNASLLPPTLRNTHVQSEVATLTFLSTTKVPVPHVYGYGLESLDNPVGTAYILAERVNGKPFDNKRASPEQKRRVYDQLATIYIQIRANGFPSIGSLLIPRDKTIGGCLDQDEEENGILTLLKPFTDSREYRRSIVKRWLTLIQTGRAYTQDPTTAYLVYNRILTAIDDYYKTISPNGPFYLLHPNDTGEHILVNDEYNIVALTNWDGAQTAPLEDAFKAPTMMLNADEYGTGDNSLSEDEKLFAEIIRNKRHFHFAGLVELGRAEHRLKDILGADIGQITFWTKFSAFLAAYAKEDTTSINWVEWKSNYAKGLLERNDEGFKQLNIACSSAAKES